MYGIIIQKAIMDFLNVSGGVICMGKMIWGIVHYVMLLKVAIANVAKKK